MARNTLFSQLVDQLRSELGASVNPAQNVNTLASHKYQLKTAQDFLYADYAWPFLRGQFDVVMQAGERYYNLPVDFGSITKVEIKWGDAWTPLAYGIGGPQYTSQNPEEDQRSDPVQAWDIYGDGQFETWPIPASNDLCTIRFYGRQALTPLVADNSRALLDDRLIVLYAAWSLAPTKQKQDAWNKFLNHYNALKKRYSTKSRGFVLGGMGNAPVGRMPPGHVRVAVDRGNN